MNANQILVKTVEYVLMHMQTICVHVPMVSIELCVFAFVCDLRIRIFKVYAGLTRPRLHRKRRAIKLTFKL